MDTILPTCLVFLVFVIYCPVSAAGTCQGGWDYFGDSCYFFNKSSMSFNESNGICTGTHGAILASILSVDEDKFILERMNAEGISDAWIGLMKDDFGSCTDDDETCLRAKWKWLYGKTSGFRHWKNGEPNPGERCARLNTQTHFMGKDCGTTYNYICKKRSIATTTITTTASTSTSTSMPTTTSVAATVKSVTTRIPNPSIDHSTTFTLSRPTTLAMNARHDKSIDTLTITLIVVWSLCAVPITLVIVFAVIYFLRRHREPGTSC